VLGKANVSSKQLEDIWQHGHDDQFIGVIGYYEFIGNVGQYFLGQLSFLIVV